MFLVILDFAAREDAFVLQRFEQRVGLEALGGQVLRERVVLGAERVVVGQHHRQAGRQRVARFGVVGLHLFDLREIEYRQRTEDHGQDHDHDLEPFDRLLRRGLLRRVAAVSRVVPLVIALVVILLVVVVVVVHLSKLSESVRRQKDYGKLWCKDNRMRLNCCLLRRFCVTFPVPVPLFRFGSSLFCRSSGCPGPLPAKSVHFCRAVPFAGADFVPGAASLQTARCLAGKEGPLPLQGRPYRPAEPPI